MADQTKASDNNQNNAENECHMPLSPILGTGQSVKKFLKSKKRLRKESSKVVQKLDENLNSKTVAGTCQNVIEEEGCSKEDSFLNDFIALGDDPVSGVPVALEQLENETLLSHIQKLEELELQRVNTAKTISLAGSNVEAENKPPSFVEVIRTTKSQETDECCSKPNLDNRQEAPSSSVKGPVTFQTGSGKAIAISNVHIQNSKKLFNDILNPIAFQAPREKKYNYLHKNPLVGNLREPETKNSEFKISDEPAGRDVHFKSAAKQGLLPNKFEMLNRLDGGNLSRLDYSEFKDLDNTIRLNTNLSTKLEKASNMGKCGFKNIFSDENFDDLKLVHAIGFKPASEIDSVKSISESAVKNDIQGETSIDNLNFGFKPVSYDIKSTIRTESVTIENTSISNTPVKKKFGSTSKVKNIFENENFEDISFAQNIGFKPASMMGSTENKTAYKINRISCMNLGGNRTDNKVNNIFGDENFDDLNMDQTVCFKPASANMCRVPQMLSNENLISAQNIRDRDKKVTSKPLSSFTGPTLNTTAGFVKKSFRNIFEGENFDDLNLAGLGPPFQGFASPKKILLHNRQSGGFTSPLRTPIKNVTGKTGKTTPQENFIGFPYEEQQASENISKNLCQLYEIISDRYQLIANHHTEMPLVNQTYILDHSKNIWDNKNKLNINYIVPNKKRLFSEVDSDHNAPHQNSSAATTPLQNHPAKRRKKTLGCPFSPTIKVSEEGIKRAQSLFEDLGPKPIQTSTPIRFSGDMSKPSFCDLTPIQHAKKSLSYSFLKETDTNCSFSKATHDNSSIDQILTGPRNAFSLNKPSEGDVGVWLDNLSYERRVLAEKLRIVNEKETILNNQKTVMDFAGRGRQRIIPGVLYRSKQKQPRVSIQEYVKYAYPGDNPSSNTFLDQINPQNAHLVHFNDFDPRLSHLRTEDGAVIVPNTKSRIGISEIEHSFKLIEGVDPNLIPKGWIRNHYKWIIWKLASYERSFGSTFEGCLSVENVVQQLKYRYDVEIDNVKRPALRKIFEKDDCAQKRMILCVSKIMKVNNFYELELTDGWYPIRTVIDQPLSDQIIKGKIKLGIKLIIYGATLMNCEGCHPLESTEFIHLKINYNSARRALWWCKLGFQRETGPFVIPMSSIHLEGGRIGCIRCYIYRIYPVKYLEKYGDKNVWRNRKAEERREQDFHNEKYASYEKYPASKSSLEIKSYKDIKNIEDPEILYDVLQKSGDPESFEEMLSATQKTILYNYTINKSSSAQYTTFIKFPNHSKASQQRYVKPMLKMKLIDASCGADKAYDFHLWEPGESHLQELKEGEVVTIFNVSCSSKWGLSANQSTQFQRENKIKGDRFQKFRRNVTYIEELRLKCPLDEFDTVGLVIEKQIGDGQEIWMADSNLKLLLIKIYESPKNILVLDTVNEGQIISVCNLVFKRTFDSHSLAVADHSVIFARYSQFKHLQDALEKLENDFDQVNRERFMQDCRNRITNVEKREFSSSNLHLDMDGMECSQITQTDMALLECIDRLT